MHSLNTRILFSQEIYKFHQTGSCNQAAIEQDLVNGMSTIKSVLAGRALGNSYSNQTFGTVLGKLNFQQHEASIDHNQLRMGR